MPKKMKIEKTEGFIVVVDPENDDAEFDCIEIKVDGEQAVLIPTDTLKGYEAIAEMIFETLAESLTYRDVYQREPLFGD